MVTDYRDHKVIMKDGTAIPTRTFLWVSGIRANAMPGISEDASDEANKFSADKYGSSYSYIDVFKYKSFTPAIPAGDWYVAFLSLIHI